MVGLRNEGTTIKLLPSGPEYLDAYDSKEGCVAARASSGEVLVRGWPIYRCLPLGVDPKDAVRDPKQP